ncbi:unnamed protein product [Bursaphelenchus xylophilus]|uniref:(pine wood nematode) hypothetical protein n=1 Tax=Bursaphelenchus xylophilus TaxID=6326 RepID=A0A1I7SAD5_BURXY|nr:unnamed protein product [Bursaphelenchus xylophilus]CAG9084030.1 unnamed protein product [Bursaphelenchus xylophilus]
MRDEEDERIARKPRTEQVRPQKFGVLGGRRRKAGGVSFSKKQEIQSLRQHVALDLDDYASDESNVS